MRTVIRILSFSMASLCFLNHTAGNDSTQNIAKPLNVILFIGDGMGLSQVYAAYTVNKGFLYIFRCPYTGFSITHSASHYITDSGAGATAISCGKKTFNNAIGVDADSIPCKTILEYAEEKGLSTGLISTSTITHATPASFIAHQKDRNNYEAIAADFLKTDIDVFIGGGFKNFAKRSDSVDLTMQLKNKGYEVIVYPSSIKDIFSDKAAIFTAFGHNPRADERGANLLPEATEKAIDLLKRNGRGFFLMVEGSQIDWACANNDANYVTAEVLEMDNAVGKALAFAEQDGNTLIIITADHETGGMAIINGDMTTGTVDVKFTTTNHTGIMVPVFAFGPGAEKFSGVYQNTEIFSKLMSLLNFNDSCVSLTQ
jgi:alkaline phosphatase